MFKRIIILIILMLSNISLLSSSEILDLYYLPLEQLENLKGETINDILQDKYGFIWFCSNNGLYQYDGYNLKTYRFDSEDSTSIANNRVTCIVEDCQDRLWVGTRGGLCLFNRKLDIFLRFISDVNDPSSLCHNSINRLFIDKRNNLWIATEVGLACLDLLKIEDQKFTNYKHDPDDPNSIIINRIVSIVEDSKGKLWIGTHGGGLVKFDPVKKDFTHINRMDKNNVFWNLMKQPHFLFVISLLIENNTGKEVLWISTSDCQVRIDLKEEKFMYFHAQREKPYVKNMLDQSILARTEQRFLWVISRTHGIYTYHFDSDRFDKFDAKTDPHLYLTNTNVIYKDRSGNTWFGKNGDGVVVYRKHKNKFPKIPVSYKNKPLSITSIYQENDSLYWFGTHSQGIIKFPMNSDEIKRFPSPFDSSSGIINFIHPCPFNSERLWIGSWLSMRGFYSFDKMTGVLTNYGTKSPDDYFLDPERWDLWSSHYPRVMIFDSMNRLWLGAARGLFYFNTFTKKFIHYIHNPYDPESISGSNITALEEDNEGNLWIGTLKNGINRYDEERSIFIRYTHDLEDSLSLSSDEIKSLDCDREGRLWIGCINGLCQYDANRDMFINHNLFSNITIRGIIHTQDKALWLNVENGIIRWYPGSESFTRFSNSDGLYRNQSNEYAFSLNQQGKLLLGGVGGINIIDPDNIKHNQHKPAVFINEFRVFNEPVKPGKNSVLKESIIMTDNVILKHDQSVFSFEFVALDYADPEQNKYAYKMEGVDRNWVHIDASRRFVTYTQLAPGFYTFRVKASNNDGLWNDEGTSLTITILPPWYKTNLAYTLYFVFFILLVYALRTYDLRRQRLKHELAIEHKHAEKLQEIDQVKTRFFANISHEFRTPITLILAPVTQMMTGDFKGRLMEGYSVIRSNAKKLLRLVNQVLALSKLEAGRLKLEVCKADLVDFIDRIYNTFLSLAEHRQIDFLFKNNIGSLTTWFDPEKIETILYNLLSNAFNHTPTGGKISVELYIPSNKKGDSGRVVISVSNTGPGIPPEEQAHIFERFYQGNASSKSGGTGIGLSLARDLVELHHGQISLESKPDGPTVFTFEIPTGEIFYKGDAHVEASTALSISEADSGIQTSSIDASAVSNQVKQALAEVLIVEDNAEMRHFLRQNLQDRYAILEAGNGREGFEIAMQMLPELIISDVMMPEMDGFEFCEQIKNDLQTSHIPVILLTARASYQDKLEGLLTGANEYLPKPFELEELILRADNLIYQRRQLRERYQREALFGLREMLSTRGEQHFTDQVYQVVEKNIDNADYNNDNFAHEMGMSRAQLHRKIKAVSGLPPHEFLKVYRLKKAAALLKANSGNITEIAYAVGYRNVSHFARLFKEQFGKTPSEFVADQSPAS